MASTPAPRAISSLGAELHAREDREEVRTLRACARAASSPGMLRGVTPAAGDRHEEGRAPSSWPGPSWVIEASRSSVHEATINQV